MRIEDKELELIREQQTKLAQIKQDLGTLDIRKNEVINVFFDVNKEVEETKAKLEKKYGRVNINLDDGTYSEIEEEIAE